MSTIRGRIINQNSTGVANIDVVAFSINLGVEQPDRRTITDSSGTFNIPIHPIALFTQYKIRVFRGAKMEIYESASHTIVGNADWDIGNIVFHSNFLTGWLVRNRTTGDAPMYSHNNKIEYHIDNQRSWSSLTDAITNAQSQAHIQQFYFQVEKMIFKFNNDTPLTPPAGSPTPGTRLEDILVAARDRSVDVKVNVRDVTFLGVSITSAGFAIAKMLPFFLNIALIRAATKLEGISVGEQLAISGVFIAAPLIAPFIGIILLVLPGITDAISTGDIVKDYFSTRENDHLKVKKFPCDFFNPLHAKYTIIDNKTVYITASPFYNGYYSSQEHHLEDYRYGNSTVMIPVHDVSARLEGPALEAMRETYNRYWNKNGDADTFSSPVTTAQSGPDTACIQVNRTILKNTFTDIAEGEAGILQSYLRAINEATDYIYLENQYFIEEKIYDILVEKIKNTPSLQLIVVVNVNMDIPGYNNLQKSRTNALKMALHGKESQFGFFTIWTQVKEGTQHKIINNYVHSKVAIIDDKWATIGSANLDEYSLRNDGGHEVNLAILNNVDGSETSALPQSLRNKIWNEHLFGRDQDNTTVIPRPASGGWLSLWKEKAQEKLASIKTLTSSPPSGRILEWTDKNSPREYLEALGVKNFDESMIKIFEKIERVYDFRDASWVQNDFCNMIKDFSR